DSMLYAWNRLMKDDIRKFRAMHELLHHLMANGHFDQGELIALEQRLNNLSMLPITQESINDATRVEEYDFTTTALVTARLSLAKSHQSRAEDPQLREIVQGIILMDQRMKSNRRYHT